MAKENALINDVNIEFYVIDILADDLSSLPKYDIIVSNPPYVLESDKSLMSSNVLDFEPDLALFVPDKDPLKFYKRIAELAKEKLNKGGQLFFEIHENYGQEIKQMLEDLDYSQVEIRQDMQEKDRMVRALK